MKKETSRPGWLQPLGFFIAVLICEAAIFIFGSYYFDVFPTNKNLSYSLAVSTVFLAIWLWFKYDKRWNRFSRIAFVLFVASVAFPFTVLFEGLLRSVLSWFAITVKTSQRLAFDKVGEMLVKTVPILVLIKLSGADFGSVFLKRGNLKLGLGTGGLVFFFLAPASFMFAAQRFTNVDALTAAVIWGLGFSIANAFMEELWLRGIFLKRFIPFLGINGSVWVTSIIFASMHSFVYYFTPSALPFFFINTLALGLGCGYLMVKSDSIWGPVIIHAASDFFLFIAVLANP
jgi:membrane protease YdiL (CAAX protease family)